jgi:hypothetical protein
MIQGRKCNTKNPRSTRSQLEATLETYPLSRPGGRQPHPWPSVRRPPAPSQVGRLLLRLVNHDLFDALELLRGFDLGMQLSLAGRGGLCVRVGCFPKQTCPSLCLFT